MALAGFNTWKPNPDSLWVLQAAMKVFEDYKDHLPLTGRQVFYRMVGAYGYEKSERAANKLYGVLGRARRAGYIDFQMLRDGGGQKAVPLTYPDEAGFWTHVEREFRHYVRNRQTGQETFVELFCEAPGMMPQLQRVAFDYSVPVYGTRGFTGLSVVGDVVRRALMRDVPTTILQVGDLDPSGVSIFDTLAADVKAFVVQGAASAIKEGASGGLLCTKLGIPESRIYEMQELWANGVTWAVLAERIALTWEQVEEHDLPTAPPSSKDSRSVNWPYDDTAQAEALPPDLLAQIVRDNIELQLDMEIYDAEVERESADTDTIREKLDKASS